MDKFDALKLKYQFCFPLYAAARKVTGQYRPYLDRLGITYTQYIALLVLWEHKKITAKELGEKLFLDSGTITPLLKSLESKGLIVRARSEEDERMLVAELTEKGEKLKEAAVYVPRKVGAGIPLSPEETVVLYRLLYKILDA